MKEDIYDKLVIKMIGKALYVAIFALPVALIGFFTLRYQLPIGPIYSFTESNSSYWVTDSRKIHFGCDSRHDFWSY